MAGSKRGKWDGVSTFRYESSEDDFYVSEAKKLRFRLKHPFPRELASKYGTWASDELASKIPWSNSFRELCAEEPGWNSLPNATEAPLELYPTKEQAVTCTRLAIASAWQAGRYALKHERGRREAMAVASYGYRHGIPGFPKNPVQQIRALAEGNSVESRLALESNARLANLLGVDAGLIERILSGAEVPSAEIQAWQDQMECAATGRAGDNKEHEIPAFLVHLATWWWRLTGRKPERRTARSERLDVARRKRSLSFMAFAEAALRDATDDDRSISSRTIRTSIEAAEHRHPCPPVEWLGVVAQKKKPLSVKSALARKRPA